MPCFIKRHAEYQDFLVPDYALRTAHFYVPVLWTNSEARLGITISKKVGNAVVRNRLRRRIKAWNRIPKDYPPCSLNLVARAGAGSLKWDALCAELDQIISDLKMKHSLQSSTRAFPTG